MHLTLLLYMQRFRMDELVFFQVAYLWRFKKPLPSTTDVEQYKLHAIIPQYVVDFCQFLTRENM